MGRYGEVRPSHAGDDVSSNSGGRWPQRTAAAVASAGSEALAGYMTLILAGYIDMSAAAAAALNEPSSIGHK